MIIAVDMDGILSKFDGSFLTKLREAGFTGDVDLHNPEWPAMWNWDLAAGATQEQIDRAWNLLKASPTFWLLLSPTATALEDTALLRNTQWDGHDLYFITNRVGVDAKWQTERWLHRYGIEPATVILSKEKGLVTRAIKADAYIDDKPSNLEGHDPATTLYLFDRPFNRGVSMGAGMKRVRSVKEMLTDLGVIL